MIDLLVIGGGVTGCAVARDAALRRLDVVLVERRELGAGTSGRFHGMLQSGARYVTTDVAYAAQCVQERRTLERIAPHARVDTGGLFVQMVDDPPEFADDFASACEAADIHCRPLSREEVAAREPRLADVVRGFVVPDAVFLPWQMVTSLAEDAHRHGAALRSSHRVTGIEDDGRHAMVEIRDVRGTVERVACQAVVIAAGPWSRDLAAMAGQEVPMELAKGSMLIIEGRASTAVVNRCRPPGSFDILVPFGNTTIFGTTSRTVESPDAVAVDADEEVELIRAAAEIVRGLDPTSPSNFRTYAGVRPLVASAPGADGAVSRRHCVIGGNGDRVFTVVGGSFTSHRAMAEDVVDRVCHRLGSTAPCTTASAVLPPPSGRFPWSKSASLQPALAGVTRR